MKKLFNMKRVILMLSLMMSCFSFADVAVVVSANNSANISDSDIKRLFLGKTKALSNGESVVVINQKFGNAIRKDFDKKALGKSSSQIKAYWSKRVFSGKGKPPKELASDADIISFIASDAKSIGYIDAANVTSAVKVIKTL